MLKENLHNLFQPVGDNDESRSKKGRPENKPTSMVGFSIVIGAGAGVAIGIALSNVLIGIAVGVGAGLMFGVLLDQRNKR